MEGRRSVWKDAIIVPVLKENPVIPGGGLVCWML